MIPTAHVLYLLKRIELFGPVPIPNLQHDRRTLRTHPSTPAWASFAVTPIDIEPRSFKIAAGGTIIPILQKLKRSGDSLFWKEKPKGIILFRPDEVDPILKKERKQTIRPSKVGPVEKKDYYEARTSISSKRAFGILRIEKVVMKKLKELTDSDARKEGFLSLKEWKARWIRTYGKWNPDQDVRLVRFKVVAS